MLGTILWYFGGLIGMSMMCWKNYLYNRKFYKRLSKMVFVECDKCISGYLDKQEYAIFYYWKDSKDFTLDTNIDVFLHKTGLLIMPYNLYWYYRYKNFILKQKTYTSREFYNNKEKLFLSIKREEKLDKILNS